MLEEDFEKASENVKKLKETPSDNELLETYALFKQATVGDINTERPGMFDLKGKAKWDAWNCKKGMAQDKAKEEYVELVKKLIEKHGLKQ